jgi:hypothetical protein
MNLKDTMKLNSGVAKDTSFLLEENAKSKQLQILSRAMSNVASFIDNIEWSLKELGCDKQKHFHQLGAAVSSDSTPYGSLSKEEKAAIKEKLKNFYLGKLDFIAETVKEMFSEEEEKEPEDEEGFEKPVVAVYKASYNDGED